MKCIKVEKQYKIIRNIPYLFCLLIEIIYLCKRNETKHD